MKLLPGIADQIPLLKLLKDLRNFGKPSSTNYPILMNNPEGQIELYNILWFELMRYFSSS